MNDDQVRMTSSDRVVRVFVSSTFRDMGAEREELVKWVFPRLRRLCEQRAVTWTEVDLRWGITGEQRAEGRVLPICLEEIRRCTFFLGLLGERYGWVPGRIGAELVERETWLAEHRDKSVTELEILHGVLRDPAACRWAYFYFRDPAFANWLHMAAGRGRVVLVLDGLNQLEDRDQAPDLAWLPPAIPVGIRLLVSTLPGRPLDELKRRHWSGLRVDRLDVSERAQLIESYLADYGKRLPAGQIEQIAATDQCANPLYLCALLEELRLLGNPLRLGEQIRYYLSARTIPRLYEKILCRYERDYERERPGLVKDAMSLIWASRRGLSEAELLEMLGGGGTPLPHAYWSPLHLASEQSLVNRSGLINFS